MNQTKAPQQTPSPRSGERSAITAVGRGKNPRNEFFVAVMNMTWQLAIVVLLPIIGGFELDRKFNTSPVFVIVGFIIAMTGTGVVLWQAMQTANRIAAQGSGK